MYLGALYFDLPQRRPLPYLCFFQNKVSFAAVLATSNFLWKVNIKQCILYFLCAATPGRGRLFTCQSRRRYIKGMAKGHHMNQLSVTHGCHLCEIFFHISDANQFGLCNSISFFLWKEVKLLLCNIVVNVIGKKGHFSCKECNKNYKGSVSG